MVFHGISVEAKTRNHIPLAHFVHLRRYVYNIIYDINYVVAPASNRSITITLVKHEQ